MIQSLNAMELFVVKIMSFKHTGTLQVLPRTLPTEQNQRLCYTAVVCLREITFSDHFTLFLMLHPLNVTNKCTMF